MCLGGANLAARRISRIHTYIRLEIFNLKGRGGTCFEFAILVAHQCDEGLEAVTQNR